VIAGSAANAKSLLALQEGISHFSLALRVHEIYYPPTVAVVLED
jgi:hypothetical protein